MREWTERTLKSGAKLIEPEGLTANEAPDDDALSFCRALGKKAAAIQHKKMF